MKHFAPPSSNFYRLRGRAVPHAEAAAESKPARSRDSSSSAKSIRLGAEDDWSPSEEIALQAQLAEQREVLPQLWRAPAILRRQAQPKGWGAGLTWNEALAYTALSPRQLRNAQRSGMLVFRRVGKNGGRVVLRRQLDAFLEEVFAAAADDIAEDFDFG